MAKRNKMSQDLIDTQLPFRLSGVWQYSTFDSNKNLKRLMRCSRSLGWVDQGMFSVLEE